jgi:hypothetical protein
MNTAPVLVEANSEVVLGSAIDETAMAKGSAFSTRFPAFGCAQAID